MALTKNDISVILVPWCCFQLLREPACHHAAGPWLIEPIGDSTREGPLDMNEVELDQLEEPDKPVAVSWRECRSVSVESRSTAFRTHRPELAV